MIIVAQMYGKSLVCNAFCEYFSFVFFDLLKTNRIIICK